MNSKGNIAVLFAGQGAQYVGMGKTLSDEYSAAERVFRQADDVLGFPISDLIFSGPEEELTLTRNSQPAIYVTSWAAFSVLQERVPELKPSYYAGLSLGEYTAYAAGGAFGFEDGLKLVRRRGELMQECAEKHHGTMASVIGLPLRKVEELCEEANRNNPVNVANINSPGQIVVSGSVEGVGEVSRKASDAGAKRVIELKVSGAFHSSLMQDAADGLREYLKGVEISQPETPVISNVLAHDADGVDGIKRTLAEQIIHPVRWQQSMEYLSTKSTKTYIECGCGKVLRGLLKRTVGDVTALGVEDPDSLEKTVAALSNPS